MQNLSIPFHKQALQYTKSTQGQPVRFSGSSDDVPPPRKSEGSGDIVDLGRTGNIDGRVVLSKEQAQIMARSMVKMADRLLNAIQDRSEVFDEAAEALEGAITLYEMSYDTLNPDLGRAHKQLGMIRFKQGNHKEAEKHLKEAKRILESNSTHHPDLPGVLKGLVRVYQQTGRKDEAESLQSQADKIQSANNWIDKIH